MMFYNAKVNDSITVFINTTTEEKTLCEILESLDDNSDANLKISKWKNNGEFFEKSINDTAIVEDIRVSQKCLYVINSIKMSFNFAYSLIDEQNKKTISNIKIAKIQKAGKYLLPSPFISSSNNKLGFLLIHSKPESISFEHKDVAFLLKDGSLVISDPGSEYAINNASEDVLYVAYGEFVDTP